MSRFLISVIVFVSLSAMGFSQSSPDFAIRLQPDEVRVSPGDYARYAILVSSIGEFSSEVMLEKVSVSPNPVGGHQWGFNPNSITPRPGSPASSEFRFRVPADADATYIVTIRGVGDGISHTASATVRYERPKDSFTLWSSAHSVVLQSGVGSGSAEVLVTAEPVGHYSSLVDLTLTQGGPFVVTFEKTRLAPWESTRITITKYSGHTTLTGRYGIQIRGTGAGGTSFNLDIGIHIIPGFEYATGARRVLFVPLRVKGAAHISRIEDIQPHIDRATEYYREVSYGQLRLTADVLGKWYDLPGTNEDYVSGRIISHDCLNAIDGDVDLRNYEFYVFLLDGWTLSAFASPFGNTNTNDGNINFASAQLPASVPGLITHEMGHMFYLPDLYDISRKESFFTYWDEMGEGAAHFSGWSRLKLGWLSSEKVADVRAGEKKTITLSPIELPEGGTKLIRIPKAVLPERTRPEHPTFLPSFSAQRSFFLEARKRIGFDSSLPSDGVLLYSVDETIPSGSGPLRLVDRDPTTKTLADAAFSPEPGDRSVFEDAANGLKISIVHLSDDQYEVEIEYAPPGKATLNIQLNGQGAATAYTSGGQGVTQAGYVDGRVTSGVAPYGVAVVSLEQNGVIVSEVGVPVSRPTTLARVFVDYRTAVTLPGSAGTVDVYTGFAAVNLGGEPANMTITLRDLDGTAITSGTGILAKDAHIARFMNQLGELFPGFSIPLSFDRSMHFGTLELGSDQPLSVVALRLTTNQRGEMLLTSTPIADMTRAPSTSAVFFPQFVDGGGYATSVFLINTSTATQSGMLRSYAENGLPLEVRMINGAKGSLFPYSIPPGGAKVFQTDGGAGDAKAGWIELTPDTGKSTPVGAGLFQYSQAGILITQSGIPSATPTTKARIYVDLSGGHDTGLALANPGSTYIDVTLRAFAPDGSVVTGSSPRSLLLTGRGHSAKFAREQIPDLPKDFRGVIDISGSSPFVALTVRSLVNARGDFLLTTFPVADLGTPPPVPIIFPQIADRGGYRTEFILLGVGPTATLTLNFLKDDGTPLAVGK